MALNDSQKRVLAAMRTDMVPHLALLTYIMNNETNEFTNAELADTVGHLYTVINDLDKMATGNATLLDGLQL